jgi:hypothetical protein
MSWHLRFSGKWTARLVVYGLAFLSLLSIIAGPKVEIRLDCGDLRYVYLGIPLRYKVMEQPYREELFELGGNANISQRWAPVPPRTTSNDNAAQFQNWYRHAAIWSSSDKTLAQLFLKDISESISSGHGLQFQNTDAGMLLRMASRPSLPVDWQDIKEIQIYCKTHGYSMSEK